MKVKLKFNSDGYLDSWGFANDTRAVGEIVGDMTVYEVDDTSSLIENATHTIDGELVVDQDRVPDEPIMVSPPSDVDQLKADNGTMQSAFMELSDYVFSIGGTE